MENINRKEIKCCAPEINQQRTVQYGTVIGYSTSNAYSHHKKYNYIENRVRHYEKSKKYGKITGSTKPGSHGTMKDVTVARLQSTGTGVQTPLSPPELNVKCCVRVSLRTVKIFLAKH